MGHGYLQQPAARNVLRGTDYCLNNGGAWAAFGSGMDRRTPCGDAPGQDRFLVRGEEGYAGVAGTYASGGTLTAKVQLTANHLGRWGLALCPSENETVQCFDAHPLLQTGTGQRWVGVAGGQMSFGANFALPHVPPGAYTLQWTYWTANSCRYPGMQPPFTQSDLPVCFQSGAVPEVFENCADLVITGGVSPKPKPEPKPEPKPTPKPPKKPLPFTPPGLEGCVRGAGWYRPGLGRKCLRVPGY